MATYGDVGGYLDRIEISVDADDAFGRGPTGTSIRENRPFWCQDFLNDPATAPWREQGARAGWASSAALPLHREGAAIGALTLYSGAVHAFDDEAQVLLIEMAKNISFALDSYARETARHGPNSRRCRHTSKLEATLDALPDLMFELGLDGRYYDHHSPRTDLLAAPPDVFMGRTVSDILPAPEAGLVMQALRDAHTAGFSSGATYQLQTPHGARWFELSVARKSTPAGQEPRFIMLARDITDRKTADAQRESLESQLRQSQKMEAIGQLAGGVAHDFNNLLTIINGRADIALAHTAHDHSVYDDLIDIRQAGERAAALTRRLLAFGRRQVVAPVVVPVQAVIAGMESMLRRLISEDISLVISVEGATGRVRADPGQLEQVLMNLAINARDAMPDGGTLMLEARSTTLASDQAAALVPALTAGRYVLLSMRDTGVGMDEATCQRIFEPFFTTKGTGTGLGLSTVWGIVSQAGGAITVDSAPQRGTTFSVYLPRVDDEVAARPVVRGSTPGGGHETILVVDDEPAVVAVVKRGLVSMGYNVLTAGEGTEALRVLETHDGHVDLVLTDVVLPGMSGRALAEHVVQTYPGTKILYSIRVHRRCRYSAGAWSRAWHSSSRSRTQWPNWPARSATCSTSRRPRQLIGGRRWRRSADGRRD